MFVASAVAATGCSTGASVVQQNGPEKGRDATECNMWFWAGFLVSLFNTNTEGTERREGAENADLETIGPSDREKRDEKDAEMVNGMGRPLSFVLGIV